ncbi:TetR/AcrR family transcriptional regulator C-terminal domain-containing protein [Archangium violaceum]|uniref:TetR/AcrR family transcriptional regulator n=1 Tax=Archangium violaceum TaxID=83451 RepID=UPI00193B5AD2|nr:TetR family transcriptional regulator [Archangium violaceum]QRK10104.1 TetR/AcrR family transcriptional regulator C-terminal domain-containing protein [Archangium violaceum]
MARKHPVFGDQAASVALLWKETSAGRRGPKPALTLEQIVDEAIKLADARGLAALSMEKLAREFGFTPMALYRYVPGKAELIALMIDRGIGMPPTLEGEATAWRDKLLYWAKSLAGVFRRHPWSLEATGRLRVMGPCELAWLEAGMGALAPTGLTPEEQHSACLALLSQIRTSAQFSKESAGGDQAMSGVQWATATRALLETREALYPQLSRVLSQRSEGDPPEPGLAWVLDGIAARIERRKRKRRPSAE